MCDLDGLGTYFFDQGGLGLRWDGIVDARGGFGSM